LSYTFKDNKKPSYGTLLYASGGSLGVVGTTSVSVPLSSIDGWETNNTLKMAVTDVVSTGVTGGTVTFDRIEGNNAYFNVAVTASATGSFTIKVKDSSGNSSNPIEVQL
jgi:hypothetical protein